MSNVVRKLSSQFDPGAKLLEGLGVSSSNTAMRLLDPASGYQAAASSGAPNTVGNQLSQLHDPGNFLHQPGDPKKVNDANNAAIAAMPRAPNQDTAANASQQQADYLRRRRGVLGNIFAGNQQNSTPVVSQKQLLGQ